ncbi:uncharacterized protein LOC142769307 [Rhipicephalus microplus]|uniref:uncharacterized protein LOC142769307 n=1 Tax=Rhipicephalus microplus TaxID=6941 RepID=UPI003F6B3A3D
MTQVFNVLKALYLYLKPRFTSTRTLFYVVGMSIDDPAGYPILKLMKTVFTPSMFVAIAHLSYPVRKFKDCRIFPVVVDSLPSNLTRGKDYTYGHTFNEAMAVVREVNNLNLSIPLAVSFSYKGIYYVPQSYAIPTDSSYYEYFMPCTDHPPPYYADPKEYCGGYVFYARSTVEGFASNSVEKRAITFVTDQIVKKLACVAKQSNFDLNFVLAAYDVDFDSLGTCTELGFFPLDGTYPLTRLTKTLSKKLLAKFGFTLPDDKFFWRCRFSVFKV